MFYPPLQCRDASKNMANPQAYVSRVPSGTDEGWALHRHLKRLVAAAEAEHPGHVSKYFNFAAGVCSDFVVTEADLAPIRGKKVCAFDVKNNHENLITPKQGQDLFVLPHSDWYMLKPLMLALVYLGGRFVHTDNHEANISLGPVRPGGERNLVLHDFSRVIFREVDFQRHAQKVAEYKLLPLSLRYFQRLVARGVQHDLSDPHVLANLRRVWDLLGILGVIGQMDEESGEGESEESLKEVAKQIFLLVAKDKPVATAALVKVVNDAFEQVPALKAAEDAAAQAARAARAARDKENRSSKRSGRSAGKRSRSGRSANKRSAGRPSKSSSTRLRQLRRQRLMNLMN